MKKNIVFLLLLSVFLVASVFAEAEPSGTWMFSDSGWYFLPDDTIIVTAEQADRLAETEYKGVSSFPEYTNIPLGLYKLLFPDSELFFENQTENQAEEPVQASLTLFELDGSWSRAEDGVFYYDPGDNRPLMTMDEVFEALYPSDAESEKTIYLTIDDAPSPYTMELLATLRACDVPATFFVIGINVRTYPLFLQAIYEEGHLIANHSFTHSASSLAASWNSCRRDFERCQQAVNEALGFDYPMTFARFPYGASTVPASYQKALQREGYLWLDWNALDGDTEPGVNSDRDAYNRAVNTASGRNTVVMLVHDGKKRTIRILPELVEHFREQGYEFRLLTMDLESIPGVRMGTPIND